MHTVVHKLGSWIPSSNLFTHIYPNCAGKNLSKTITVKILSVTHSVCCFISDHSWNNKNNRTLLRFSVIWGHSVSARATSRGEWTYFRFLKMLKSQNRLWRDPFSLPHSWPVVVWSGFECQIRDLSPLRAEGDERWNAFKNLRQVQLSLS